MMPNQYAKVMHTVSMVIPQAIPIQSRLLYLMAAISYKLKCTSGCSLQLKWR